MPSVASEHPRSGISNAISNMAVRVMSEYTGRGPTRARTYIQGDLITVVMGDTLTRGERKLVESGNFDKVRDIRRRFQDAMREELVAGIEAITGRRVLAFLSDNHMDPDLAVETILLEPRAKDDPPEIGESGT
ncbi:MAG: hypothetical protein QOC86_3198 [Gaiellales bacterium]|nr:hypothetical protein [Gaiellales bacterium]